MTCKDFRITENLLIDLIFHHSSYFLIIILITSKISETTQATICDIIVSNGWLIL